MFMSYIKLHEEAKRAIFFFLGITNCRWQIKDFNSTKQNYTNVCLNIKYVKNASLKNQPVD